VIVTGETVGRWVCEKAGCHWDNTCQAIGWQRDGELVAAVMYDNYTGPSVSMYSRIDCPTKLSRSWYRAIFDYPFNHLKVKAIRAMVSSANKKAQQLDEHVGFKIEAWIEDYFEDGDGIMYVLRPEHCRFIGGQHG